jgi:hypothetical protein
MSENGPDDTPNRRRARGGWIVIVVLAALLAAAALYAIHVWNGLSGTEVSAQGWFAMALGVVFTLALGIGLMALVFYSSRHNYDR